jgi:hypothetical protein
MHRTDQLVNAGTPVTLHETLTGNDFERTDCNLFTIIVLNNQRIFLTQIDHNCRRENVHHFTSGDAGRSAGWYLKD